MWDCIRIETQFANFFACFAVISAVDGVGQEKFRLALRGVAFNWDNHCGANQDAILFLFGNNNAALFNAKALAQFGRHDNRAPLSNSCRSHGRFTKSLHV